MKSAFETLRTYEGYKIFKLDAHLDRLFRSMALLKINTKLLLKNNNLKNIEALRHHIQEEIKSYVQTHKSSNQDLRLKIIVLPQNFHIESRPLDIPEPDFFNKGVCVNDTVFERECPEAKYPSPAYEFFATARPEDCFETIYFSEDDWLREGSISNVFAVIDGKIITPGKNILLGVTRQHVLEIAQTLNIPTEIREISREELKKADEIFCTNTSKEIIPVRQWGQWENDDFSIALKLKENFLNF